MGSLILLGYAFLSNVAIALVPHEPVVAWYGKHQGIWSTAIIATLGTLLACWVDRTALLPLLFKATRGKKPGRGLLLKMLGGFGRAPFLILALSGLTPLPFWPFKVLAHASDYPLSRYLLAIGTGRLPRYLLLAWFGQTIPYSNWGLAVAGLAFGAWALIGHLSSKAADHSTKGNQDGQHESEAGHQELHG